MTKELYEKLTDKEKVEWLGLLDCKMEESIPLFISKLESIGIVYQYGDDVLEAYLRLEAVVAAEKRERKVKFDKKEKVVSRGARHLKNGYERYGDFTRK